MNNPKRIAVFIDNSNVFHNIQTIEKSDKSWVCLYDPLFLAKKLAGERNLAYIGFYCVRPPSYLLAGEERDKRKYNITQKYYSEIEKLPSLSVKYGDYKSAIENTKKFSKKIEVVFFRGSLSMSLREVCDITRRARRSYFRRLDSMDDFFKEK